MLLLQFLKVNQFFFSSRRRHTRWLYIADFYCHELKLVIEIDGSVHNIKEVMENDIIREDDIKSFGIKVVRFKNYEIRNEIENVIEKMKAVINEIKCNARDNEK